MIADREGFGDVLANGSRRAADLLGQGHDCSITVKGAEAPAHMPQAKRSLALIYAVNPFGADHQSSEHDPMIEEGASDLYLERLKLLGLRRALPAPHSLGPGQGPLRPQDPAVLLVPRHGLALPVRVGPGLDPVRAAGDGRLRARRDRLGRLRRRRRVLARLRDRRCKADAATIARALEGTWRREHLFELRQAVELFDVYRAQIAACEAEIEAQLGQFADKRGGQPRGTRPATGRRAAAPCASMRASPCSGSPAWTSRGSMASTRPRP